MHRRGFLQLAAHAFASTAVTPISSVAQALGAIGGSNNQLAVAYLLAKRQQLMTGGFGDEPDLQPKCLDEVWSDYSEALQDVEEKFLGPVEWNPSLMTPAEASQFEAELASVRRHYASQAAPLEAELRQIDAGLAQHPQEVRAAIADSEKYYTLQSQMTKKGVSAGARSQMQAQLDAMPEPAFDFVTVEDAGIVVDGGTPKWFKAAKESATELDRSVSEVTAEVRRGVREKKPEDWQEQRKKAQLDYLKSTLHELALEPEVRIESTLTKGYGNDNWVISTRMHADDIGEEQDKILHAKLENIARIVKEIYPERANDPDAFIRHVRPEQPGYGEHDCERLTITNPDFALRKALVNAESINLKRLNAESGRQR